MREARQNDGMTNDSEGLRRWLRGLLEIPPVGTVVDAGCGRGDDVLTLAMENPSTSFVGIDRSGSTDPRTVTATPPNARFIVSDLSTPLPFPSGSVDVLYSINVLECLADQTAFLRECARVLRPQGQIVAAHYDWDTQTFDGADRDLVRRIVHSFSDWQQPWMDAADPWAGRRLRRLFADCGDFAGELCAHTLLSTSFEPGSYGRTHAESIEALVTHGMLSHDDYETFMRDQMEAAAADAFLFSVTMVAFVGRKRH
jgi:ubiquinone/menaquinone biosynthesis C-methylase UbiE